MSSTFCTIITGDYLFYVLALRDSLYSFDPKVELHVLVTGTVRVDFAAGSSLHSIKFHQTDAMCSDGLGRALHDKYYNNVMDWFRWSMKPVFLNYLFQKENAHKLIYVDADIYFFNHFDFLFKQLEPSNVLLSPHWRSSDAVVDSVNFEKNLTEGLFNGGFFGATREAKHILDWWANACLYECIQDRHRGLYVDQKYLDMMPIFFGEANILRHRGCNVAEWNAVECKRTATETGEVLINGIYPIVFVHFTSWLYQRVLNEDDFLLKPYVEKQVASLRKYNSDFKIPMPGCHALPIASTKQAGFLNKLRKSARRIKSQF